MNKEQESSPTGIVYNVNNKAFWSKMAYNNAVKANITAWMGLAFGLSLLILDFLRYQKGLLASDYPNAYINRTFLLCHIIQFFNVIPIFYLREDKQALKDYNYKQLNQIAIMVLIIEGVALVSTGFLGVISRGSLVGFSSFILIVNHFFYINGNRRLFINLVCFGGLALGVFWFSTESTSQYIYLFEGAAIFIPSFLISNIQLRMRYENYLINQQLEQQNKNIQATNKSLMMRSLQGQMNPHFIFNTLNSIQHFMINQDQKSSLNYLSKFARLIRLIFRYSSEKLITLENEIEFLKLYLNLEQLRFENKFEIDFKISPELSEKVHDIHLPPLLIQPLIENAFKHGLMHKEERGKLEIYFYIREGKFICKITDNGVGRKEAIKYRDWLDLSKKQNGENELGALDIIKQRLKVFDELLENDMQLSSSLEIVDLFHEDGTSKGTQVMLSLCMDSLGELKRSKV